ncbi:MAG: hypothetical protein J6X69_05655 [Bacteroidales bacterium]|nr:hypothetical protein [Bacteroidales bacterium]
MKRFLMHILLSGLLVFPSFLAWAGAGQGEREASLTGKDFYIDVMEKSVAAYDSLAVLAYIAEVEKDGIQEHGFARLTANIGILLSQGRIPQKRDLFVRMMDLCISQIPVALARNGGKSTGNDFSVKEICCCLSELEKNKTFDSERINKWKEGLKGMKAEDIYTVQPSVPSKKAHNWCIYGSASECARLMAGIGGNRAYADKYFADQLRYFDENGMYKDPHQPIVYDIVTRLQLMAALDFGYDGPVREDIEKQLFKSALPTLWMQSSTGEIPYGGRSNQFLHNDSFYAAVFEYYASWMQRRGDASLASRFKAAAVRARASLAYWLSQNPVRHIKNHYPTDSGYGCEKYAYFNKYMVTTGSWAYLAWRFADDGIVPSSSPEAPVTFVTSDDFHQIVMNAGDYTVQFDVCANGGYDSNGIGRIQKRGAPSVIALASPCPAASKPKYKLELKNPGPLALSPSWDRYVLEKSGPGYVELSDGGSGRWLSKLSKNGLVMTFRQEGPVTVSVPIFAFDGEQSTDIHFWGKTIEVNYGGWCCRYTTNGRFVDTGLLYANRNGHFRRFDAVGDKQLRLECRISKRSSKP